MLSERFRDNSDTVHVVVEKFIPVYTALDVHLSSDGCDWRKNTCDGLHSGECLLVINIIVFLPPTILELPCARKSGARFPGRIPD